MLRTVKTRSAVKDRCPITCLGRWSGLQIYSHGNIIVMLSTSKVAGVSRVDDVVANILY